MSNLTHCRRLCFLPLFNFPNQTIPYFGTGGSLFPNLTTFNCCGCLVDSNWFRLDLNYQNLRHLSIPYSADRWFPSHRRFPRLDSLYLVLVPGDRPLCPRAGSSLHVYHSLTRLSVHHSPDAQWPQLAWCTLKFPNLKALNIQGIISCPPRTIYGFIQRHSTLLEVNVGFKNALLRLEGLIKLMNGTGTWNTPESTAINRSQPIIPQRVAIACSRDQVNFKTFHGTRIPVPDDMPGSRTTFSRFGFVREPITADAIQWRSSKGSEEARYNVTSLALGIQNLRRFPSTRFEGFLRLSSCFPTLQELRVESVVEVPKNSNFVSYMVRSSHLGQFIQLTGVLISVEPYWSIIGAMEGTPKDCFQLCIRYQLDMGHNKSLSRSWTSYRRC